MLISFREKRFFCKVAGFLYMTTKKDWFSFFLLPMDVSPDIFLPLGGFA